MSEKAVDTPSWRRVGASRLRNRETANGQSHYRDRMKRLLDIVAAATLFVVISPLLAIIAAVIKLDSKGPILFEQRRRGLFGKPFTMYKFRTMFAKEQDDYAIKQSQRDDTRVTRFGSLLRRYSLDELPQIFNVLRGDMSFIGPRPPLPREVSQYEKKVRRRLLVKPGLTGLWQVGGRSDLSWEESVRLDVYYVENWTLFGDFLILARTARAVLSGHGAY